MSGVVRHQMQRQNAASYSIGQVSDEPLSWTVLAAATVGAASGVLVPAGSGVGRTVALKVPSSAADGILLDYGADASATDWLLEAGESIVVNTEQEVRAIRAGAADVTVYRKVGVVA